MEQRMQTRQGKRARKIWQSTVEPVLGTLVDFTAMRQVTTKGIALANKCMIMAAVAYNLKKLLKALSWPIINNKINPLGNTGNLFIAV